MENDGSTTIELGKAAWQEAHERWEEVPYELFTEVTISHLPEPLRTRAAIEWDKLSTPRFTEGTPVLATTENRRAKILTFPTSRRKPEYQP
jgi:hypothetical protein